MATLDLEQSRRLHEFKKELMLLCKKFDVMLHGDGDYGISITSYHEDYYKQINFQDCISQITPKEINTL